MTGAPQQYSPFPLSSVGSTAAEDVQLELGMPPLMSISYLWLLLGDAFHNELPDFIDENVVMTDARAA